MATRSHSFPRRLVHHDSLTDVADRATEAARKSRERIIAAKKSRAEANAAWEANAEPVRPTSGPAATSSDVTTTPFNAELEQDDTSVFTRTQRLGLELPRRAVAAPLNGRDLDGNLAEGELITVMVVEATPAETEPADPGGIVECVECAPAAADQKHFTCGVCLQNKWRADDSSLALSCCGIEYCGDCWSNMLGVALQSGNPLSCPSIACRKSATGQAPQLPGAQRGRAPTNRPHPISSDLLNGLKKLTAVNNEQVDELRELGELLKKPNARRCPSCNLLQLSKHDQHRKPEMTCTRCAAQFCYHHGDAHPGQSCAEFTRTTRNKVDVAFARKMHTKRCPNCLRSVWKNGGCNHMTCVCGSHWQWSAQPVEVPCHCLNLKTDDGKLQPWGCPPCKGASPIAHAKLAMWRSGVVAVSAPIVVSVATVVLPVLAAKAVLEGKVKPQLRSAMRRHRVGSRGYRRGTFEYNFHMHGNGREQVPRWLR